MCNEHPDGLVNLLRWIWIFKEAPPTGHVCGEEVGSDGVENGNVQSTDDGK